MQKRMELKITVFNVPRQDRVRQGKAGQGNAGQGKARLTQPGTPGSNELTRLNQTEQTGL